MRQVHVQVRGQHRARVLELANEHRAFSPTAVRAEREDGEEWWMIFLNLPNDRVGAFTWAVREEVEDAQFVLFPSGTLPIQTPLGEVHTRVRDVAPRSTLELVLSSLQSLGSWRGLLLYAFFSGVVAAYGVIFSTSYLLVAAMLIAPMGAPVMVSVIGVAIGDWRMFGRGALRFVSSILVLVLSAMALGYLYRLSVSTSIMESISSLSVWTVAVALVAGAAGAQSQVQSTRASLVTGTATGFLIAAALSPTSAVLGLSVTLQRWDYTGLMAFQLALQFVAIVVGGWLSLLLFRVVPGDPSVGRGTRAARVALAAALVVLMVGMVAWQESRVPGFRKADLASDAIKLTRDAVQTVPHARLLQAEARFTRPDLPELAEEALLVSVVVLRTGEALSEERLAEVVRTAAQRRLSAAMPGVVPFLQVTVLPGPTPGLAP